MTSLYCDIKMRIIFNISNRKIIGNVSEFSELSFFAINSSSVSQPLSSHKLLMILLLQPCAMFLQVLHNRSYILMGQDESVLSLLSIF